jgi:hypothetical protein
MSFETTAQAALGFALSTLKSMNAKFKISLPDGTEYSLDDNGNLLKRMKRNVAKRTAYKRMYVDQLKQMEPGADMHFDVPESINIDAMRSSISSCCSEIFGSKKFSTKIVNGKIIVWRFKTNDVMELASA